MTMITRCDHCGTDIPEHAISILGASGGSGDFCSYTHLAAFASKMADREVGVPARSLWVEDRRLCDPRNAGRA